MHYNFLLQIANLLEHNDFLTSQSQRLREFYKFMATEYPNLAFAFKGRIVRRGLRAGGRLQHLELSKIDVNMFSAANNSLINDSCGLYRGRLILPYEHLSRFQNDLID